MAVAFVIAGVAAVLTGGNSGGRIQATGTGDEPRVATTRITTTTTAPTTTTLPPRPTLTGKVSLIQQLTVKVVEDGGAMIVDNPTCSGEDGFDDIHVGAAVTVRDGSNSIIATGAADRAEWVAPFSDSYSEGIPAWPGYPEHDIEGSPATPGRTYYYGFCEIGFSIPELPEADFYTVEVSHRGGMSYSAADLEARGWQVSLSLG